MGIDRRRLFKRWGHHQRAHPSANPSSKNANHAVEQPSEPEIEPHNEYPSEIEYGNQVNGYDQYCGRGHGDAGHGYGSANDFGPSGGSVAEVVPDDPNG